MSIRVRFFLWISGLFLLAFTVSWMWQTHITDKNLQLAAKDLAGKILELSDYKRQNIEKFSQITLANSLAEVEALLTLVKTYPSYRANFITTPEKGYNWARNADLLVYNKWLDIVQNTSSGRLTALITPDDVQLRQAVYHPINGNFAWVIFPQKEAIFLGVQFLKSTPSFQDKGIDAQNVNVYYLFSKEALNWIASHKPSSKENSNYINLAFLNAYGVKSTKEFADSFIPVLEAGLSYSTKWPTPEQVHTWSAEHKEYIASGQLKSPIDVTLGNLVESDQKITMIAVLASYFAMQLTADAPSDAGAPSAIAYFQEQDHWGRGFFTNEALRTLSFYKESTASSIVLIPEKNKIYIGQTLALSPSNSQDSYLTVGINPDVFAKELALSNHQMTLAVSLGKVVGAYDPAGIKMTDKVFDSIDVGTLVQQKKGFFSWDDEEYFFLCITPFSDLDFHFLLCNLKEKEFAMIQYLQHGTKNLIDTISLYMGQIALIALVVVLICLNYLVRRITTPIIQLAKMTEKVKQGHLDEVDLTDVKNHAQGEILTLSLSFEEMVQGLKEKERVRSVLNKVVSPQIAAQILQAPLELGGEERKMTMLFADIRSFTEMTQNMAPNEVIELLNSCMDKLSATVDQFGGVIDKYVGDEVMAIFGFPNFLPESILQAVYCAINMLQVMHAWNEERKRAGLFPITIGIGIHAGEVVAGNMGAKNRLNYTVLGSHVNLAARLCNMAGSQEILVTKTVAEDPLVKEKIRLQENAPVAVKGFSNPVMMYKVIEKK